MKNLFVTTSLVMTLLVPSAFAGRDEGRHRGPGRPGPAPAPGPYHDYERDRRERERYEEIQRRIERQRRENERLRAERDRAERDRYERERYERDRAERERREYWENQEREQAAREARERREAEEQEAARNYGRIATFLDVTRKSGGEWMRVQLASPAFLDYVQLMPVTAALLVHEVSLVTESGRRVALPEFNELNLARVDLMLSDYIRAGEKIIAVDIRAESMGGSSNLFVTLKSADSASLPAVKEIRP